MGRKRPNDLQNGSIFSLPKMACILRLLALTFIVTQETAAETCPKTNSCSLTRSFTVKFPFQLIDHQHDPYQSRCGYPGFSLSCNGATGETLISFATGDFTVQNIFYDSQKITINDPEKCLPRRFLDENFTLLGTPFRVRNLGSFTLLNCSSMYDVGDNFMPVSCLSGDDYTVVAIPTVLFESTPSSCRLTATDVSVPVFSSNRWWKADWGIYLRSYVELEWQEPSCGDCEKRGGDCRFVGNAGLQIGCFNLPRHGLSKGTQYTLFFICGLGIIAFLCFNCGVLKRQLISRGLSNIIGRSRNNNIVHLRPSNEVNHQHSTNTNNNNNIDVRGLDETIIETYPKTLVGDESSGGSSRSSTRMLLKSNYSACPICLSEYQPKDTLRTLPDCFHYFHSDCIDEWLRLNATCPLCRNSPLISSPYS